MRKYFYFIAAVMVLETAGIGFSTYMNGKKLKNLETETICQSDGDSVQQPQSNSVNIRHVI